MSIWSSVDCTAWAALDLHGENGMYTDTPKVAVDIGVARSGMCGLVRLDFNDVETHGLKDGRDYYLTRDQVRVLITALQSALEG